MPDPVKMWPRWAIMDIPNVAFSSFQGKTCFSQLLENMPEVTDMHLLIS